jgi:uncharacterized protein (DUF302 family)
MLASPTSALDLPLKLLVWEDADGKTWLTFNDPQFLLARHQLSESLLQNISLVGLLAEEAAGKTFGQ